MDTIWSNTEWPEIYNLGSTCTVCVYQLLTVRKYIVSEAYISFLWLWLSNKQEEWTLISLTLVNGAVNILKLDLSEYYCSPLLQITIVGKCCKSQTFIHRPTESLPVYTLTWLNIYNMIFTMNRYIAVGHYSFRWLNYVLTLVCVLSLTIL